MFDCLDKNGNGTIEFGEHIDAMSTLKRGTISEKIMFSFRLCDPDKDEKITHDELIRIIRALSLAVGGTQEGRWSVPALSL